MFRITRALQKLLIAMSGLVCPLFASAQIEEISDAELSKVTGLDGVTIMFHLEWNSDVLTAVDLSQDSKISVGFYDATQQQHSYLVWHGFGGIMDMWALKLDASNDPVIGDYIDITFPQFFAFKQFGVRALSAQTTPDGAPTKSYGQWLLNGFGATTGHLYIWPAR